MPFCLGSPNYQNVFLLCNVLLYLLNNVHSIFSMLKFSFRVAVGSR